MFIAFGILAIVNLLMYCAHVVSDNSKWYYPVLTAEFYLDLAMCSFFFAGLLMIRNSTRERALRSKAIKFPTASDYDSARKRS